MYYMLQKHCAKFKVQLLLVLICHKRISTCVFQLVNPLLHNHNHIGSKVPESLVSIQINQCFALLLDKNFINKVVCVDT